MMALLGKQACRSLSMSTRPPSSISSFYHVNADFDAGIFQQALKTKVIGRTLIYRPSVSSTMDVAQHEADQGTCTGALILAEEQTEGRGRANRPWISPVRANLYFTLILRPKVFSEMPKLNFATAIALVRAARALGVEEAGVKWPNDVWVNRKKLAGILTDSSIMGSNVVALVGVGLNVNQKIGREIARELVLASFCNELEELLAQSFENVLADYKKVDVLANAKIWVMPKRKENPERKAATVLDISEEGNLVVKMEDSGEVVNLLGEEVSIRAQ